MPTTWKQTSMVGEGGRVEVTVPELKPGDMVEVEISHASESTPEDRPLGLLKGKIIMSDDFDEPLEDFEPYTR